MAKNEFDLEQAEYELDNVEDLLSVFWGFFNEERPFGEKADTAEAIWFVKRCKIYESVINAAWDKVRKLRIDMETAIEKQYSESRKKGGEADFSASRN